MGLVSCADLLTLPADVIAKYELWASDLGDMYDLFIRNDDEDVAFVVAWSGSKNRSDGIHASEMAGECQRPVWYSLRGEKRQNVDVRPFWKKKFRVGQTYHAMIQEDWRRLCEKSNGLMSFEREVRILPELQSIAARYDIKSSCDGVITFRDYPHGPAVMRVGLEIKTESSDQYSKLKGPKDEHKRQTCVYMKCLDVPLLWTMYVNKGNQNIVPSKHPYLYQFDFELWGRIERETKEIHRLATINQIPPRVEGLVCQFCGYSWICQPESAKKQAVRDHYQKEKAGMDKRLARHRTGGIRVPERTP